LIVNPFIRLPVATTLPYTYKTLPTTLPPSSTGDDLNADKPKFIISSTGLAAHPEDIISSCEAVEKHIKRQQEDAEHTLQKWLAEIKERELAEKRRLAPGYLDRHERILQPEKRAATPAAHESILDAPTENQDVAQGAAVLHPQESAGAELDRAFGNLKT